MSEPVVEEATPLQSKAEEIASVLGITPERVLSPTPPESDIPPVVEDAPEESDETEEPEVDEIDKEGEETETDAGGSEEDEAKEAEGGEDPAKALMEEMAKLRQELEEVKNGSKDEEVVPELVGGADFKVEPLPIPTFLDPNVDVEEYMTPGGLEKLLQGLYQRAKVDTQKEMIETLPQAIRAIAHQVGDALLTSRDKAGEEVSDFYSARAKEFENDSAHDLFLQEVAVVQSQHPGWSAKDRLEAGYARYSKSAAAYAKVLDGKGGKVGSGPPAGSTPTSSRPARRTKRQLTGHDAKQEEINKQMGAPSGYGIKGRRGRRGG